VLAQMAGVNWLAVRGMQPRADIFEHGVIFMVRFQ